MNLAEYIKNNEVLSKLDFMTVYLTIKELKEKMLTAVGEIDLSKLTLYDLSTVSNIVKTISDTDDEKFSTAKYCNELLDRFSQNAKTTYNSTIADLKERE